MHSTSVVGSLGACLPASPPKNSYPKIQSPSYDSLVEVPEFLVDCAQNYHRFCVGMFFFFVSINLEARMSARIGS